MSEETNSDTPRIMGTPEQWCKEFHVHIEKPLGWTMYGKNYHDPISRAEFQFRLTHSIATTQTPKPPCH